MNGNGRMSASSQIIVSSGSELTLLASTSRMLAEAETVEDHIRIVASEIAPLYEQPTRPLEDIELRAIKRYLQELANTFGQLRDYHRKHPVSSPDISFVGGGGKIFISKLFHPQQLKKPMLNRAVFRFSSSTARA